MDYTERALVLTNDEDTHRKTIDRKIKAHLHMREGNEARAAVEDLIEGDH